MKHLQHENGQLTQVAVADGSLPAERIFAELIAIRYPGCLDLEHEIHENDPMAGMQKSFAFVRGCWTV